MNQETTLAAACGLNCNYIRRREIGTKAWLKGELGGGPDA
jgi:hypothetical protein